MGLGAILEILRLSAWNKFYRILDIPLEPDDEVDLGLSSDVEVTGLPGLSL